MTRIYLASSWRNAHQPTVLAELRAAGHNVYDFRNPAPGDAGFRWRHVADRPIETCADLRAALAHPMAQRGYGHDRRGMDRAQGCVLLLPSGRSAHLEAGWIGGTGRPVAVLVPELHLPLLAGERHDAFPKGHP